jgi:hypothetical protein
MGFDIPTGSEAILIVLGTFYLQAMKERQLIKVRMVSPSQSPFKIGTPC